jgi:ATP-dependent exoDNAse (exonuclease V) beta subunit
LAEKERQQQALDSLNMLYVDFTRAVDRLHIISPKLKKNNEKNCHTWLYQFATTQSDFDTEKQQLSFGVLAKKQNDHHKKGLDQLPIPQLNFNRNSEVVQIKGSSKYQSNEEVVKAREYGILVHYILSQIKTKQDIDGVITKATLSGDVSKEEAEKISTDIKQLLELKMITPYFEEGVEIKNEVEILTQAGDILRPDRVVIQGNQAIVIDYKTGKKNAQKYHAQMQDYEYALLSLGYASVKKLLLYIHEQEVEVLS